MSAWPTTTAPRRLSGPEIAAPGRAIAAGRADRLAKAVLLALGVAFALAVLTGSGLGETSAGTDGARLGGDYPAFHAAGSIVGAGDVDQLYVAERQQEEQVGLGVDGYLAFAYPPHVAVAYAPLAALGFRAGYAVHTVLMVAAIVAAIHLVAPMVPLVRRHVWPATALVLGFYPLFKAVGGGQNTALTVLAFAAVWRALRDDRDVWAGVAIGLLLYRPQYAIPLIGLLALDRRWRAVGSSALVAVCTWAATALMLGPGWVSTWLDAALPFVERDAEVNAGNSISLMGALQAVLGRDDPVAVTMALASSLGVVAVLAWFWVRAERFSMPTRISATALGVILISPHAMFYDSGLLVVVAAAALALVAPAGQSRLLLGLGVVWLLGFVHLAGEVIGATPLALVVVAAFAALVVVAVRVSQPGMESARA